MPEKSKNAYKTIGEVAKELGLVDGLGNVDEILKEKFGENVVIKKFEKPLPLVQPV